VREQGRIFRRGVTWWIAFYHRGYEHRESAGSEKPADAKRLLKKRLAEIHGGRFVGPERVTLSELLDALKLDYELNGRRSIDSLNGRLAHLRAAFPFDRAIDVTEVRIEKYKEERLKGGPADRDGKQDPPPAAPGTVNRELAALRRAFRLAVDRKLLSSAPKIKLLKEENTREGFVEVSDFEAVVAHLPPDLQDFARFGFLTGTRKGEIASLTWSDVDLAGKTVRLQHRNTKNARGRVLALEGELLALILKRHAQRFVEANGTVRLVPQVFHHGGAPVGDLRKSWNTARNKAGLPDLRFHDLRRSAVRNMVGAGVPETVAMRVSGHVTRSVFDRYNVTSERDLREAVLTLKQANGGMIL
jgi:integrase